MKEPNSNTDKNEEMYCTYTWMARQREAVRVDLDLNLHTNVYMYTYSTHHKKVNKVVE